LHAPDGSPFFYDCAHDDVLGRSVVWTDLRHWEETTHPLFYRMARQARGFLDAGAFSGLYTLLACQANPNLRAVAVEPNPQTLPKLQRNVSVNRLERRVAVVGKALSAQPGRARLAIPEWTAAASLVRSVAAERVVDVDVTTGDDVVGDLPIDLVKIDVEGLEAEVLRGLAKTIAAHRPAVIAECLDRSALDALRLTAQDLGYEYIHHFGPGGLTQVERGFVPTWPHENFLLTAEPPAIKELERVRRPGGRSGRP
jgi:FkbM family methyltransferase